MKLKEWKIKYDIPDIPAEFRNSGYSELLSLVLAIKGAKNLDEANALLSVGTESLHDSMLIKDMSKAVDRINLAIKNNEKVAVYGDYDVDGITSTCLVTDYLQEKGLSVTPYIPDRSEEGYGINFSALQGFANEGISLVITVDCGITAFEETNYASTLGIDMIITDHHECKDDEIPNAVAVIDTKQKDDNYPNKSLAGVGTAFKLLCALDGNTQKILDEYSDFVALGTVADVMPLTDENRCLVFNGLEKIRNNPRPGFIALFKSANITPSTINSSSIGYSLAPRINAAGRLNQPIIAFNLLMSKDSSEAEKLASKLDELNKERQSIETDIWKQAGLKLSDHIPDEPIVLASRNWHQGVIGIAASRLAEQYNIPTVMIYLNDEGVGKGSCRSYGGFNLFEALNACSDSLISFGGHALAAGLNIRAEMVEIFRNELSKYYKAHKPNHTPEIECDLLITSPQLLSVDNVKSLDMLEPYGNANTRPLMCILGAKLESLISIGNGKHLKMIISFKGVKFSCVYFSHSLQDVEVREGDYIDIAFSPRINDYFKVESVQLVLQDIRLHNGHELCGSIIEDEFSYFRAVNPYLPSRQDFINIWRTIKTVSSLGNDLDDLLSLAPSTMLPEMYCIGLKVFQQAGLLSSIFGGHIVTLENKVDLDSTDLMNQIKDNQ